MPPRLPAILLLVLAGLPSSAATPTAQPSPAAAASERPAAATGTAESAVGAGFVLDATTLLAGRRQPLPTRWRFSTQAGAADGADPAFPGWRGPPGFVDRGVFALDVEVPVALVGRPLALSGRLTGAAEVSFGDQPIGHWGDLEPYRGITNPPPLTFTPIRSGNQTLRIDYANPHLDRYRRAGWPVGFALAISAAQPAIAADGERIRQRTAQMWGFTAFFLGFAALHLLLGWFGDERRGNLDFALVCATAAGLAWLLLIKSLITTPEWVWLTEPAMNVMGVGFAYAGLWWVYGLFREERPRRLLAAIAALATALAAWGVFEPRRVLDTLFFAMLLAFLEMSRVAVLGVFRRRVGALALAFGILTLSAGFSIGLLTNLGFLPRRWLLNVTLPFASMVALILFASLALSRRMGEYARRSREIEEARALQLSMLPRELPQPQGYELAGAMDAATEVGGDYYDAALTDDGALVLTIGDATGHGAKAGTLVTAMKGIFGALAGSPSGAQALATSNRAFARMGLRPMAMALTWARCETTTDDTQRASQPHPVRIALAGTPPPHLVRAADGHVEVASGGAPPLGLLNRARYTEITLTLEPGDVMVLFTDGFPEALGTDGEQLGYERATKLIAEAARRDRSATEVVGHLRDAARVFRGDGAPEDDVTFLVLRRMPVGSL